MVCVARTESGTAGGPPRKVNGREVDSDLSSARGESGLLALLRCPAKPFGSIETGKFRASSGTEAHFHCLSKVRSSKMLRHALCRLSPAVTMVEATEAGVGCHN